MDIQKNVSLADKNWFQTGGCARWYVEPQTEQDFQQALRYAVEQEIDVVVLGSGANVLVSDKGFDGLVIKPALRDISFDVERGLVHAQAGVLIPDLIDVCLSNGFIGLEEFSGIPGTVGGSVYINIHYFEHLLSDFIVAARVVDRITGEMLDVDASWFKFGYDQSVLLDKKYYLVHATFTCERGDAIAISYARGRQIEMIRHRLKRYPAQRTCGSFFRNFHDHEVTYRVNGKKIPFVAYYLDKLGVKGELCVGNAAVSHQHANMLITKPGATSTDVIALACKLQDMVYDCFGMMPQPECQLIGFTINPFTNV